MADRYWVGGAGTWDTSSTTHWSASSGGASGASAPTSADNVFFDSASNSSSYAVTLGSNFVGTASASTITAMTSTVTVVTVTSGSLAVGNLIFILTVLFKITSFGTGSGGAGTYNCSVLRGANGTGFGSLAAYSPAPICADISFSGPVAGTLTWVTTNSAIEVAGGATVAASGVTMSNLPLVLTGASTHTLTTNSVGMGSSVYLCGTGTYTLGSAYTASGITTGSLYFSLGTFSTANFALTVGVFDQDSSGTRTINLGSSTVTIGTNSYPTGSNNPSSVFGTNVTFNAGTSQVNFTGSSAFYFSFGVAKTWYNFSLTSTGINQQTNGGIKLGYTTSDIPTFNNFTIAGQTNDYPAQIYLQTNMTVNGTLTLSPGTSVTTRLMLRTDTLGTARTITVAAFAAGAKDIDWQDIAIAGAAGTISGTRFGDCGGNTGITFPAAKTVYWNLAGAQNWSATAWAATSGAAPAVNNFPLAQDTAVFDNTGSVTGTITINGSGANVGWNIGSIDMSARTSAMTLAASSSISYPWIYGSWTNGSGVTISGTTGPITFSNRSTQTINSAGKTFTQDILINAPGGGLQLLTNNLTTSSATAGTGLVRGTLDLNNLTFTTPYFDSNNTNTRVIAFGTTGAITMSATIGGTIFVMSTATGFTYTGTSNIVISTSGVGSTRGFAFGTSGGGTESNALSFSFSGAPDARGSGVCKNLDLSACTAGATYVNAFLVTVYGNATFNSSVTFSASGFTMTFGATSGTKTITTGSNTMDFPITFDGVGGTWSLQDAMTVGSTRTTTLTNGTLNLNSFTLTTGVFNSSYTNTRTLAFGTGKIVIPSTGQVWNTSTATNLTVTGTPVVDIDNNTATAVSVFPGTPTESNSISFNFINGTYVLGLFTSSTSNVRNLSFTGFAGSITGIVSDCNVYGNLTFSSGMSMSSNGWPLTLAATSGTKTITTAGFTIPISLTFNGVGGTWSLQDTTTMSATATLTNGTVDLNSKTFTVGTAFTTAAGTKNLTFNGGTLVCSSAAATAFNNAVPTGFTTTAGTGTGYIQMTAATAKTFVGGGSTYNCVLQQAGAGQLTITGSNSFGDLQATTAGRPSTILFTAGTTTTFTSFTLSGTAGNLVTIGSVTAASHTLSKSSGYVIVGYLSISRSTATGGAGWYAGTTSTDGGNNLGWLFTAPPPPVSIGPGILLGPGILIG